MAIRGPRGLARNRPDFREVCEGGRPNIQATRLLPFTGLPHVRIDYSTADPDPIVLDAGTIVGVTTGNYIGSGTLFPAIFNTGSQALQNTLKIAGSTEASNWAGPTTTSGNVTVGIVKPLGVIFAPVYGVTMETAYTNYKRTHSVAFLTDYVIQVPATNSEEVLIEAGDVVMVGTGNHYGAGWTSPYSTNLQAGRYAKYDSTAYLAGERIVGRCLKKVHLGYGGASTTTGDKLGDTTPLSDFTVSQTCKDEFNRLDMVESLPGSGLSGSATKGVPAFLLGARADSNKNYWALTILIRL